MKWWRRRRWEVTAFAVGFCAGVIWAFRRTIGFLNAVAGATAAEPYRARRFSKRSKGA